MFCISEECYFADSINRLLNLQEPLNNHPRVFIECILEYIHDKNPLFFAKYLFVFRAAPTEEAVFAVLEGFNPSDFVCKEIGEKNYKIEVRVSSKSAFVTKFKNGCTVGDDTVSASDPKYKERKRSHSSEPNKNEDSKKSVREHFKNPGLSTYSFRNWRKSRKPQPSR